MACMTDFKLMKGDCLERMKEIEDRSIDMILCDLPYGFTNCKWDNIIDLEKLKKEYLRVLKNNGVIVLFTNQPFTTALMNTFKTMYSHVLYWKKNNVTGALNAKKQPMRCIEEILVFYKSNYNDSEGQYEEVKNYLQEERKKAGLTEKGLYNLLGSHMGRRYFARKSQFRFPKKADYEKLQTTGYFKMQYEELKALYEKEKEFRYYPQGLVKLDKHKIKRGDKKSGVYDAVKKDFHETHYTNYPKNFLEFNREKEIVHPTQKPTALLEYLVKTYTKEGQVVLDNTMGSGSTGVACGNTGRKFIGIELDDVYFEIAKKRIEKSYERENKEVFQEQ